MFSKTRDIPDRIPMVEKTQLPNYIDKRVGHHTPNDATHFHGDIPLRNPETSMVNRLHGAHGAKETRVRNHPTFQSTLFTKQKYEDLTPKRTADRPMHTLPTKGAVNASDMPLNIRTPQAGARTPTHAAGLTRGGNRTPGNRTPGNRTPRGATPPFGTHTHVDVIQAAPAGYMGANPQLTKVFQRNGRADHVETVIKSSQPAPRFLAEATTYKTKHCAEGFQRHHTPNRVRDPVGKINSTHWNAHDY